ncbi:MAG: DUF2125 domain-containing protein [Sulfitobacter sp.]
MRWLIRFCVVLAVLWCGWWWGASTVTERAVSAWFEARRTEGWQAELNALKVTGFPSQFQVVAGKVILADPRTSVGLETPKLDISAPAYWPGDVTLRLPEDPIILGSAAGVVTIRAMDAQAKVEVHPGAALELEGFHADSGPWQVNVAQGNLMSAEGFSAEMSQDVTLPERYNVGVNAKSFAPGDLIRAALALPADWPITFDTFAGDLMVTFATPLDRHTLKDRRVHPRSVELRALDLVWGDLRLGATGAVAIDTEGTPEGEVKVSVENWRQLLDFAERGGVIDTGLRAQAELVLNALANLGGDPNRMIVNLGFKQGQMFVGPIPVGPAPKFTRR